MAYANTNLESETSKSQPSWYIRLLNPWVAIPLLLVVCLLAAPFVYRQSRLVGLPDIEEPFDIEAFLDYEIDPAENAYADYEKAISLYVAPTDKIRNEVRLLNENGWQNPSQETLDWMDKNQPALDAWKVGVQKPIFHEVHISELKYESDRSVMFGMLDFSHLVSAVLNYYVVKEEVLDMYDLIMMLRIYGLQMQRYPCGYLQYVFGLRKITEANNFLVGWVQHDSVTVEQLRKLQLRLATPGTYDSSLTDALNASYISYRNNFYGSSLKDLHDANFFEYPHEIDVDWMPLTVLLFLVNHVEYQDRLLKHWHANQLRYCDLPRYQRPARTKYGLFDDTKITTRNLDILTCQEMETLLWNSLLYVNDFIIYPGVIDTHDRLLTVSSILDAAIALEIYRREHGEYPKTLAELPKKLLPEIPRDIFHPTGAPIKYKRDSALDVTLYSVGENGIDDGGKIKFDEYSKEIPDLGYRLDPRRLRPLVAPKPAISLTN